MYNKIGHKYKIIIFKLLHQLVGSLSPPIFSVVVSVFRRRIWAPVPAIRIACWEFLQNTSILFNTDPSHELENTPFHQSNLYFLSFLQLACVEQPGPLLPLFSQCLQFPLFSLFTTCMYCAARSGTSCWAGSCLGAKGFGRFAFLIFSLWLIPIVSLFQSNAQESESISTVSFEFHNIFSSFMER